MTPDIEEKASKFEEFRPQTPDLSRTLADEDEDLNDTDDPREQVDATSATPAQNLRDSIYDLKKRNAEMKKNYFDGKSDSNCECQHVSSEREIQRSRVECSAFTCCKRANNSTEPISHWLVVNSQLTSWWVEN